MHPSYLDFVDINSKADYLSELASDLHKEQIYLSRSLSNEKNIIRYQSLIKKKYTYSNMCVFIQQKQKSFIRSVNLLVKLNGNTELKLRDIMNNLYFEVYGEETLFSTTNTIASSRLYNRYLKLWLDDSIELINSSDSVIKINVFDFNHIDIPNHLIGTINIFTQEQDIIMEYPEVKYCLEVLMEKNDNTLEENTDIKYLKSKRYGFHTINKSPFTFYSENAGYCIGIILCFETTLENEVIPDLVEINIISESDQINYGIDDILNIETPEYKYSVLIFDKEYRSREHIGEILDGYVHDMKKINGINISSEYDYPVNTDLIEIEDEEDYNNTTMIKLNFDPTVEITNSFQCYENMIFLDVMENLVKIDIIDIEKIDYN